MHVDINDTRSLNNDGNGCYRYKQQYSMTCFLKDYKLLLITKTSLKINDYKFK